MTLDDLIAELQALKAVNPAAGSARVAIEDIELRYDHGQVWFSDDDRSDYGDLRGEPNEGVE